MDKVKQSHNSTRYNYDRLSRWYDWFASSEKHFTEIGLRMLKIQPGEKVLEIGFGAGQGLVALAHSAGETGKVYGIDLSEGMFQIAQAKIARAGLSRRVELRLGDAARLPFEDDFFDAIFISFTLELFDTPEIPLVLGECKRVLREDGRLGVVALEKKDCRAVKIYEWFHARMPALVDCRPIHARKTIEAAGFELAEASEEAMWGLPVEIVIARKYG
ncbi:methyltransferase domain-containing protein [bacterium]|nr:methyltransferase domain-containing protein [bacterium]OIO88498.1 MAG: 2-heptaprenyl-1,4-naphthoquinone methyltransferase [Anaerolineae bacterium CG2_30_58_95]PIU90024.1 MAG: 2-heptaprenyl-1,4-naphthoquinone methyltransferase [Anaerolineae bacterium CG06_land_8_20_14_3_00_57_67]